ncbi:Harbinger transposase-derived nuclease domain [Dillenia turbinata]|uniref:Harbinger transposase-derived nuclease domain n=1 Tax=Dillenia turbinata TaxID=194707 RepID=A0AAN8ZNH6_9MAGN
MTISRMLNCSGYGERLNGNITSLSEGVEVREYIIGGVDYPLLPWLITPYEGDGLSPAISRFNAAHEVARSLAVKTFSRLKGTWRILNKVLWRPDKRKLPSIILVCCLLHNIIIDNGDQLLSGVSLSGHHEMGYSEQCCKQVDLLGKTVSENLVAHLQKAHCNN